MLASLKQSLVYLLLGVLTSSQSLQEGESEERDENIKSRGVGVRNPVLDL